MIASSEMNEFMVSLKSIMEWAFAKIAGRGRSSMHNKCMHNKC